MDDFEISNGLLVKYHDQGGEVVIPEGITGIGASAFYDCYRLTGVMIPDTVTSIGEKAFFGCKNLIHVRLPQGLTEIAKNVFCYCSSLLAAEIPAHVTHIRTGAFLRCPSLERVTFPEGLVSIGDVAFMNCFHLKCADIPESVTDIGDKAFKGCISLKRIPLIRAEGAIIYEPKRKIKFRFSEIQKLVLEREYSVSLYPPFKYDILFQMYMLDMDVTGICAYIKEQFPEMFCFLIDGDEIKIIQKLLASSDIVTKENIDVLIRYAIEQQKYEIQLLLIECKRKRDWYDDETEFSKKFEL